MLQRYSDKKIYVCGKVCKCIYAKITKPRNQRNHATSRLNLCIYILYVTLSEIEKEFIRSKMTTFLKA